MPNKFSFFFQLTFLWNLDLSPDEENVLHSILLPFFYSGSIEYKLLYIFLNNRLLGPFLLLMKVFFICRTHGFSTRLDNNTGQCSSLYSGRSKGMWYEIVYDQDLCNGRWQVRFHGASTVARWANSYSPHCPKGNRFSAI